MNNMLKIMKMRFRHQFKISYMKESNRAIQLRSIMTCVGYSSVFVFALAYIISFVYQLAVTGESQFATQYVLSLLFWVFGFWTLLGGCLNSLELRDIKQISVFPLKTWQVKLFGIISQLIFHFVITCVVLIVFQSVLFLFNPFPLVNSIVIFGYGMLMPLIAFIVVMVVSLGVRFFFHVINKQSVVWETIITIVLFSFPLIFGYSQMHWKSIQSGMIQTSLIQGSFVQNLGIAEWMVFCAWLIGTLIIAYILSMMLIRHHDSICCILKENQQSAQEVHVGTKPLMYALVHKELKQYLSSFTYIGNTIITPILLFVISNLQLWHLAPRIPYFSVYGLNIGESKIYFSIFVICVSLMTTSACSFSFEGQKIWLSKSLPLSLVKISVAKGLVNILVFLPGIIFAGIVILFHSGLSGEGFGRTALLVSHLLMITSLGLYINIKMPRYDWLSEMEVVKQSGSVIITAIVSIQITLFILAMVILFDAPILYVLCGIEVMIIWGIIEKIKQYQFI